ncbi:lysozyme [Azospirillum brasilense]|uniref:lysozyme n=1 Tax=Azospirillum brasilense TaxID=192 RepID=UPI001EDC5D47|nr:lysozyme [Azospirillum brasilense]UKJ76522.1 lysozyme [Azospirillum brasilense]
MTTTPSGAAIPRETHPDALALVRHFEGLYLEAYLCPAGVPTIGYGHTAGVRMGQTINGLQAEVYLRADMANAAAAVDRLVTVPLTDQQRGALPSFVFNLGAGALQTSTLLRLLNQRDYVGAGAEFPKWVYATVNGVKKQLDGLKKRRAPERAMFEAG